jgi:HK97 family phage major capsid protein
MSTLKNLHELTHERNNLLTKMQEIALKGFTADNRSAFDRMQQDVDGLEAAIALENRMTQLAQNRSFTRSPRPGSADGSITAAGAFGTEERKGELNKAFRSYFRTGQISEEYRDLLTTSDATGGALIPQEFFPELTNSLKYSGPIATKVKNRVTDGNRRPLKVSLGNDTANGLTLLATQGTSSPQETDPVFESKLLGADTVTGGLVKISFEEFADSNFSLDSLIREYFGLRYARGIEKAITLGVDNSGTQLPNFSAGGLVAAATVGQTTSALADGIGWNDLTSTLNAVDPAYQNENTAWAMSSTTRNYLVGLKDGFGRPYFTPDPSGNKPFQQILGYDIVINQSMVGYNGTGGANAVPILFGDLQRSYLLRTDGAPSILRLNERYADTLEYGFFMWSRIGGMSLIPPGATTTPLVSLKLAAS